jgi:hypothetical protein
MRWSRVKDLAAMVDIRALPFRQSTVRRWQHETNCRHVAYHLTCAEFEMLEREADGFCDICAADLRHRGTALDIDHDHAIGRRAVRGLLCASCNARLASVDLGLRKPTPAMQDYIENAWYIRVGLEPVTCPSTCTSAYHAGERRVRS